ncbi:FecR family protein [Parabacteroides pacaensis]|uniref:FecR family protein n=1 Tax=Parabacteroides pacaensis TaxID=2086575 RepID=UPI000D0ED895|nr:FecR family protein [Parabacteroides pacaensis]
MEKHKKYTEPTIGKYINRIYFLPVKTDKEKAYIKIWHDIHCKKTTMAGVSPFWKYFSMVASFALLIVISLEYVSRKNEKEASVLYEEVTSIPGTKTKLILPDQTVVWLNSKACLRYPRQFAPESRTVELAGEAFFEVKKDKAPFIIHTNDLRIQVVGTTFNILSEGKTVETTLVEGKLALYNKTNRTSVPDVILEPDQQARYSEEKNQLEIVEVNSSLYSSWVTGTFNFEENTLQEIIQTLERAFHTNIKIEGSERLKKIRLTAQFVHQETLDDILSILQKPAKYKYKKVKGKIIISEIDESQNVSS